MQTSTFLVLWGSPVGLALFFAGLGVLLWGVSKLKQSEIAEARMKHEQHATGSGGSGA